MSASRRLFKNRARADLAAAKSVLSRLDPDDYFGRAGLEGRSGELEANLDQLDQAVPDTFASAALFFGGAPVVGSVGVESSFGGLAVNKFQDLVAKLYLDDKGDLGQRGPLPDRHETTLHITGVLKGSFGFLLEELPANGSLLETPLKSAVARAVQLLSAFGDENDEVFDQILGDTGARTLATAQDFFNHLSSNNATVRLVTEERELDVLGTAITRATERALSATVVETEEPFVATLRGLLPETHMFELMFSDERGVVTGRVSKTMSAHDLSSVLASNLNQQVLGRLKVRTATRQGEMVRRSFILLELTPTAQAR
ncbi:hypothetical protein [Mesorhizobium sp. M0006]|uniref:hypothetical protein n=1 Tax=Mesorhizobium sp. M0006 TaxID=2956838 RepID=UPI0033358DD3